MKPCIAFQIMLPHLVLSSNGMIYLIVLSFGFPHDVSMACRPYGAFRHAMGAGHFPAVPLAVPLLGVANTLGCFKHPNWSGSLQTS